jgi:drug/metabolite transporter (DMT)-like permease
MNETKATTTRGMILMVLSMVAFAVTDTLVKVSASSLSPAQVLFFLIGGGLVFFVLVAKSQGEKLVDPRAFAPVLLLRYFVEVAGMVGMVLSLAYVPLSTVGAITQASPILVTVGAVLFLREKVSWRRWSSIAIGFIGVLLVIQPGAEKMDVAVFWAVMALVAFAVRDLVTRLTPTGMASASLATYTMAAALPCAVGWVLYNGEALFPVHANWAIVAVMVGAGSVGYLLLIASLRIGEVSVVMPFRYSRIIFLLFLGVVVFDERPNTLVLIGATLIIVSGIYMMWREHQLKQELDKQEATPKRNQFSEFGSVP